MTDEEARIIRHALTGGQGYVYRRHYVVSSGSPAEALCADMTRRGLMKLSAPGEKPVSYIVTAAGAAAVGLHLPSDRSDMP